MDYEESKFPYYNTEIQQKRIMRDRKNALEINRFNGPVVCCLGLFMVFIGVGALGDGRVAAGAFDVVFGIGTMILSIRLFCDSIR